jgi:hypothetical protein
MASSVPESRKNIRIVFKPEDFLRIMYLKNWDRLVWHPEGTGQFKLINPMVSRDTDTFNNKHVYSHEKKAVCEFNDHVFYNDSYTVTISNDIGNPVEHFVAYMEDILPNGDMPPGYVSGPILETMEKLKIISPAISIIPRN